MIKATTFEMSFLRIYLKSQKGETAQELIAAEEPFSIYINDKHLITMMVTPEKKKELVVGHLIAEGIVRNEDDIKKIEIKKFRVNIKLSNKANRYTSKSLLASEARVGSETIAKVAQKLRRKGLIYRTTHGTHFAAIVKTDGQIISFAEDVGRHNAIDKAIGDAILEKIEYSNYILFASCRQQASTVLKAAQMGISILVSLVSPLESGIKAAKDTGITLICAKRSYLNIYTYPKRVLIDSPTFP